MNPYRKYQGELSVHGNLLLYQNRLVILKQQQQQGLQKLHNSHQGIQCCRLRAKSLVWWLHIHSYIDRFIKQCCVCQKYSVLAREPLHWSQQHCCPILGRKSHQTYFTCEQFVDYFSLCPVAIQLKSTTSASLIKALKSIFSDHGVPSVDLHEW